MIILHGNETINCNGKSNKIYCCEIKTPRIYIQNHANLLQNTLKTTKNKGLEIALKNNGWREHNGRKTQNGDVRTKMSFERS